MIDPSSRSEDLTAMGKDVDSFLVALGCHDCYDCYDCLDCLTRLC